MTNELQMPITDPTAGTVTMDIPKQVWDNLSVQGKIAFITHQLVDFMAHPAFHAPNLKGVRFQVREEGIIMPKEVVAHIGQRYIIDSTGAI
jgi:hypothetical protein